MFLCAIALFSVEVSHKDLQTWTFDKYIIIKILIHQNDKYPYLKEW